MVVYDEADRLFEMGFAEQIKSITERMPSNRQSLLFSATISSEVKDFSLSGMKDYRMIQVDRDSKVSDQLKIHFLVCKSIEKEAVLLFILREQIKEKQQTIVFAAHKYQVEYLSELALRAGLSCDYIYGAMDQRAREERLFKFRKKYIKFLFVTDLAARGIDIPLLENVVHYDFPTKMKLFIHRSGRTARAGQSGTSYSIVTQDEMGYMHDLSIFVGRKHQDRVATADDSLHELINNPSSICYGTIPQQSLDEYSNQVAKVWSQYETVLGPLMKSIKLAKGKYNKTRDPASKSSVILMHRHVANNPVAIHPQLLEMIDPKDVALNEFKQQLS